jgi:hypothetical protein
MRTLPYECTRYGTALLATPVAPAELGQHRAASLSEMTRAGQEVRAGLGVLSLSQVTLGQVDEAALPQFAQVTNQGLEGTARQLGGRARPEGALPTLDPL